MNDEFWAEMESFNRRIKGDDRLSDLLAAEMHVINDSGAFALQVGDITIPETRRTRAEDFDHILDIIAAINAADMIYLENFSEQEIDYDYDYDLPDVGPPGSGAIITEYTGNEPGLEDGPW
jgi:hypothetical protein